MYSDSVICLLSNNSEGATIMVKK